MDNKDVSAMILAGGFSSRMGRDKADLELNGKKFIEIQTDKMRSLGIDEIMLSGYKGEIEGTVTVPDVYPHRGPLSGVHACLSHSSKKACLVVSVDVPLLPVNMLSILIKEHENGITVLVHGEKLEPLMAVYDTALTCEAEKILQGERTPMMKLYDSAKVKRIEYKLDPILISNCNTPEDYNRIIAQYEINESR